MNRLILTAFSIAVLALPAPGSQTADGPGKTIQIGSIDYFGYGGIDLGRVKSQLPVHVGDRLNTGSIDREQQIIGRSIKAITGKPVTDVAIVCCDQALRLHLYIGLSGNSSRTQAHNQPPKGNDRLDDAALKLYGRDMDAIQDAVRRGVSSEDDSNGYALETDPAARKVQLEIRAYAVSHENRLETVLKNSSDAKQRQASACLLGYANRSAAQIQALANASADADGDVRNNAVRALSVLASSKNSNGIYVNPAPFIDLLFSGQWTDRNKSSFLLFQLSRQRDPVLLGALRKEALAPLMEGAEWSDPGHSTPFLFILGRIEGIPEARLQQMVANGDKSKIIQAIPLAPHS